MFGSIEIPDETVQLAARREMTLWVIVAIEPGSQVMKAGTTHLSTPVEVRELQAALSAGGQGIAIVQGEP